MHQLGLERGGIGKVDRVHPDGARARDIAGAVVDEHAIRRAHTGAVAQDMIDRGFRFQNLFAARYDRHTERACQTGMRGGANGPSFRRPVGDRVKRVPVLGQALDQVPRPLDRLGDRVEQQLLLDRLLRLSTGLGIPLLAGLTLRLEEFGDLLVVVE